MGDGVHLAKAFHRDTAPQSMSAHVMIAFVMELSSKNQELKAKTVSQFHEHPDMFDSFCKRLFSKGRAYLPHVQAVFMELRDDKDLSARFVEQWTEALPDLEKRLFIGDDKEWVDYLDTCCNCPDFGPTFCKILESPKGQDILLNLLKRSPKEMASERKAVEFAF